MLTLEALRDRVRTRFEAESSTRWSDAQIDGAINAAVRELSEGTGFYERNVSIPIGAQQVYYDLRGYVPEEVLAITAVWSVANQLWLEYRPPERMPLLEWERVEGAALNWFARGLFWLGIFPRPGADGDYLRAYYTGLHPTLVNDDDPVYDMPEDFGPALEDYALYELQGKDGETSKALLHYDSYVKAEGRLMQTVQARNAHARESTMGHN